jgi:hypothetical protein
MYIQGYADQQISKWEAVRLVFHNLNTVRYGEDGRS